SPFTDGVTVILSQVSQLIKDEAGNTPGAFQEKVFFMFEEDGAIVWQEIGRSSQDKSIYRMSLCTSMWGVTAGRVPDDLYFRPPPSTQEPLSEVPSPVFTHLLDVCAEWCKELEALLRECKWKVAMTARNLQTKPDLEKKSVLGPKSLQFQMVLLKVPVVLFDTCQMEEPLNLGFGNVPTERLFPSWLKLCSTELSLAIAAISLVTEQLQAAADSSQHLSHKINEFPAGRTPVA
ncbi:hypothetical protein H8959_003176, partial [Pygathrix nigripes]